MNIEEKREIAQCIVEALEKHKEDRKAKKIF